MAIGTKTVLLYSLFAIFTSLFISHIAFLATKQGQEKVAEFACSLRQKTFLEKYVCECGENSYFSFLFALMICLAFSHF
jgi:hypothetical protein